VSSTEGEGEDMSELLIEPLGDPLQEVNLRLAVAAADIALLRAEIARLDRDLDESRRLNLRAAELLHQVHERLDGALAENAMPVLPGDGAGR
jgi:chromosome segregation ATPase